MKIRSPEDKLTLMEVVNGTITDHLPTNSVIVGTSTKGRLVPDLEEYMT